MTTAWLIPLLVGSAGCGWALWLAHRRNMHRWLVPYFQETRKRRCPRPEDEVHLLLCVADHFEPKENNPAPEVAWKRLRPWIEDYPRMLGHFRDSDGRPPRHTFFYPVEEYDPEFLQALAALCARGFGEVEIHLHHDRDTAEALRAKLLGFKELLATRHGLLAREQETGELAYGFIHGNWALDNARSDGKWCGVNNELDILRETGCYADFTLPAAPDESQTRKLNSIYYACDDPLRPKSHDCGSDVGARPAPAKSLLLIQGPLLLDWKRRKWGLVPRIENGCVQASQPASITRLPLWLKARVQVPTRPDWFFVKLHAHGAMEASQPALLGEPMIRFHQDLAQYAVDHPRFHYHYVTAREMYNLVRAAEAGWKGTVEAARDYQLIWNGGCQRLANDLPEVSCGSAHS